MKREGGYTVSLFWFDRLQYSDILEKLIIFEFFETDISNINKITDASWNSKLAENIFDKFTYKKHCLIRHLMSLNSNIIYYLIFYSNNDLDKKIVIEYKDNHTRDIHEYTKFEELQSWFLEINNIDGDAHSKPLGKVKSSTEYAKNLLFNYWKSDINANDDQGFEFTKSLLTYKDNKGMLLEATTKGFDFDLFIFFEENNTLINIEFALNEKGIKENFVCTPMKYCWGYGPPGVPDNKMKYNRLWKATKLLNGVFSVLNYSENNNALGLSVINALDYNKGFLNETKYIITKDNFEKALVDTANEGKLSLKHFEINSKQIKQYDQDFFSNWRVNRKKY